jgi:hypothetical protein
MKTETNHCPRHEELLDYLYDELAAPQSAAFARHLDECAACNLELQGLRRLRTDLRAWDHVAAPHLDLVIPRSPWQALKECFTLIPLWGRGAFALSAAASLLLMAFGAYGLLRSGQPTQHVVVNPNQPATITPVSLTPELKAQVEAQVAAAVAQAVEKERQTMRAQLAELETRNASQQQRVQTQLRALQTRYDTLLAEQQPSLRRMMAQYESASDER